MHIDLGETGFLRLGEEFIEVVEGGVHAAVGAEAEEMELAAVAPDVVVGGLDFLVVHQGVAAAGHIYLHEVLVHYAAGAEVHMPDLAVAHLAVGQADVFAAGVEVGHRIFGTERVDERGSLGVDCIAMVVASFAPTVENHQKYFLAHSRIFVCYFRYNLQIYCFFSYSLRPGGLARVQSLRPKEIVIMGVIYRASVIDIYPTVCAIYCITFVKRYFRAGIRNLFAFKTN